MAKLHPTMVKRAAAVQVAHAHLAATVPGFAQLGGRERMRQVQAHVRTMGAPAGPRIPSARGRSGGGGRGGCL